jgi:hypothetical protein
VRVRPKSVSSNSPDKPLESRLQPADDRNPPSRDRLKAGLQHLEDKRQDED